MTSSTPREYSIIRETGNRKQSDLLAVLLILSLLIIGGASPVHADWNVNLSDYQTNENLTVTGGRLVLGNGTINITVNTTYSTALLNCDEGAGGWCYDPTAANNSAQLTNVSWVTDTPTGAGAAMGLNGLTSFATIPNNASNDLPHNMSYGAFYNYTHVGGTNHSIMNNGIDSFGGFFLFFDNARNWTGCKFYDQSSSEHAVHLTSPMVLGGVWHQDICVLNSTHITIFHDGEFNNTQLHDGDQADPGGQPWHIGADIASAVYDLFNGSIDELGIWNYSLTASQVADLWLAKQVFFFNESVPVDDGNVSGAGYSIYQFDPSSPIIIRAATVTKDNNVNVTVSYSVYGGSWSAYTTDISPYINNQYSSLRVNVTITNGNATNPWVSSITIVSGTGIDLVASLITSVGTVVSAIIGIIPLVITLIAYFAVGGFIGGLFFMILDKMSP